MANKKKWEKPKVYCLKIGYSYGEIDEIQQMYHKEIQEAVIRRWKRVLESGGADVLHFREEVMSQ